MIDFLNINIKQIPEEGMELAFDFPAKDMELDYKNFKATGNVTVDLQVVLVSKEIIVQGNIEAIYIAECDRCLTEVEVPVSIDHVILTYDFKGEDFIDISPEIREEILVALPTKTLCKETCEGLCPGCKVNLNNEKCKCSKHTGANNPFGNL